jgi:ABC-type antimicrobial peptide transport system permease subunit
VGVAADVSTESYDPDGGRDIFLPFGSWADSSVGVIARGDGPAQTAADILRATAVRLEPPVGLLSVRTLDDELAGTVAAARLMGQVLAGLGLIGLFIAMAGLYGITAQLATQRRKELGIRKALGATDSALCSMLIRESAVTLLLGIVPGLLLGQLTAWSLRHSFPTLEPFDWMALTLVPLVVFLAGVSSALLPFLQVLRNSYAPLREL